MISKRKSTVSNVKIGTHLTTELNAKTGEVKLKWNWEVLEHEVKSAILAHESLMEKKAANETRRVRYVEIDLGDASPEEAIAIVKTEMAKKGLIAETETKVAKSRAKKGTSASKTKSSVKAPSKKEI